MANPRKFSEKIALHNQKQAEETAAFEKIMREVSDATSKPDEITLAQFGLGALSQTTLNDGATNLNGGIGNSVGGSNGGGNGVSGGGNGNINNQNTTNYRESRGRSVGVGPMRRPADRKIDTSPYSSGNTYLSPPSDSSWRRTSSDSAIHQSLQQNQDHHLHNHHHTSHSPLTLSPASQRRGASIHGSTTDTKPFSNEQTNHNSIGMPDGRPRSSCGLSRLPGINIYPSAHDNSIQIPIANNTGSLPDLTSVHFPSPLHTPIDQEHDHSSSPYSSSPVTASPSTLSPTSMPTRYQNTRFQFSPAHSPGDSNTFSPTHSQHNASQQFLSVPGNNRYQHVNKGITLDNSYQGGSPSSQQSYVSTTHSNQHSQSAGYNNQQNRHPSPPNNNVLHGSHGNLNNLQQPSLSGYRSPQCRPSPGSSPGLIQSLSNSGDSNPSAPCSPAPPLGNNGQNYDQFQTQTSDGYYINQSIQQHFEQFSLVDNPSTDYVSHSPNAQNFTQFDNSTFTHLNSINLDELSSQNNMVNSMNNSSNINLSNTNLNLSNSNIVNSINTNNGVQNSQHNMNSQQQQQQQQQTTQQHQNNQQLHLNSQTPNTPTSIPEIIFTDFSSGGNEFSKDIFPSLDLELGTMDYVSYQMLSDPTLITDSRTEDSFREDLDET